MYISFEDRALIEIRKILGNYRPGADTKKYWCEITKIVDSMNEIRNIVKGIKQMENERKVLLEKVRELESLMGASHERRVSLSAEVLSMITSVKHEVGKTRDCPKS